MRQRMSLTLCRLEQIYHERDLGRYLTQDESDERYTAWDIGLDTQTIDEYYLNLTVIFVGIYAIVETWCGN